MIFTCLYNALVISPSPSSISLDLRWKEGSCPGTLQDDRLTLMVAMLLATVLATAVTSSSVQPLSASAPAICIQLSPQFVIIIPHLMYQYCPTQSSPTSMSNSAG